LRLDGNSHAHDPGLRILPSAPQENSASMSRQCIDDALRYEKPEPEYRRAAGVHDRTAAETLLIVIHPS